MDRISLLTARTDKHLTQAELAEKSGVDQSQISRIERGAVTDPANSTVEALENALELERGTLVFGQQSAVA